MRIATTKPTGKQMTTVIATAAICIMAFACRTAFAAATTPVPEGLVDLTTASAGYFAAYYSSSHKTYPMDRAFDNGSKTADGSRWLATVADNIYVTYKFKVATVVDGIGILIPHSLNCETRAPKDWTFSGSNDGETWTTLDTQSDETGWSDNEFRYYHFANSDSYLYYKFNCTANNGATDYMQIQEIEFYGPEQDLPVFTDLTTSSAGSVTGYSTVYANKNYNGNKAFDNAKNLSDDGSRFLATYNTSGMYVIYKFNEATAVNGIGIQLPFNGGTDYSGRAPNTWTFAGSNDGETWTTLDTRTGETGWVKGEFRHYEFRARMPFQYYKFNCTALNGSTQCMQIIELEFYYSEPDGPASATWTGSGETDLLSDAGNWNSEVPGLSTFATIAATGSKDAVVPGDPMAVYQLHLGSGSSAVLRQTNGVFAVIGGGMTIGRLARGNGLLSVSGGTFVSASTNNASYLGARSGTGTIEVSGTGRVEVNDFRVGFESSGGSGAHGILRLSENGALQADGATIGHSSYTLGEFFISGNGTLSTTGGLVLGNNSSATGMVFQTGGTCQIGGDFFIGYAVGGVGRYEMTGGICSSGSGISIGRWGNGTCVVSGPGTVLTAGASAAINGFRIGFRSSGHPGTGTLVVTNGGKVVARSLFRGDNAVAEQSYVTFDDGVVEALVDNATFLNKLENITLGAGGLAIESNGHNLGITTCVFNAAPGAKISVTGGGTMTFTDTTVNLAERPKHAFTFAETDGTFSGLPTPSGSGGWKLKMSNDAKRIRIVPSGLLIIVQ